MNIFAKVIKLEDFTYSKVSFYSIVFEGKTTEENEFYDFLTRMESIEEIENDLSNLLSWIDEIGENYGAKKKYFRPEGIHADTSALPPPRFQMLSDELIVENLRLYCFVANEHIVFLFNGGIKTELKAQDCPNVGMYIKQANDLTRAIEHLFNKEIFWNEDFTDLKFKADLEIEI